MKNSKELAELRSRREFLGFAFSAIGLATLGGVIVTKGFQEESNRKRDQFVSEEKEQWVVDLLWQETKDKRAKGIVQFPWPQGIEELDQEQRIKKYAESLAEIWQNRKSYWTSYDQITWESEEGKRNHSIWMDEPVERVSELLGSLRDKNVAEVASGLVQIHDLVLGNTSYHLGEIPKTILAETLKTIGATDVGQLKERIPDTVTTLYSLAEFSYLEASIRESLLYPKRNRG